MTDLSSTPRRQRRPPDHWHEVLALARRQHGVVAAWQLRALGITEATISRRVSRGHLHRLHRGVYAVGRPDVTRLGRYRAALLAIGDDAALSHQSAAGLHEIREDRGWVVHVTVTRKVRSRRGIRVHQTRSLGVGDVTERDGMRVTTPMRTLVDLGSQLSRDGQELAVATAMRKGLIREPEDAPGRRSLIRRPRFTRSRNERRFLTAVRTAGLPDPLTNHAIGVWEADFYWPDHRLVVEVDPWITHHDPISHENDRRKSADLHDLGIHVHRTTERQLEEELDAVVARVVRLIRSRG